MKTAKQLLIIRHAKSDWNNGLSDFDRPLNKRGKRNAPEMAKRLLEKQIIPDLVISSPANRAITTAGYFAEILNFEKQNIQVEKSIYEAEVIDLMNVINSIENNYKHVALFGHNPGLTNLAYHLCSCNFNNIPTCGIVSIIFPFDNWAMISGNTGYMEFFDYPKNVVA